MARFSKDFTKVDSGGFARAVLLKPLKFSSIDIAETFSSLILRLMRCLPPSGIPSPHFFIISKIPGSDNF